MKWSKRIYRLDGRTISSNDVLGFVLASSEKTVK